MNKISSHFLVCITYFSKIRTDFLKCIKSKGNLVMYRSIIILELASQLPTGQQNLPFHPDFLEIQTWFHFILSWAYKSKSLSHSVLSLPIDKNTKEVEGNKLKLNLLGFQSSVKAIPPSLFLKYECAIWLPCSRSKYSL